ncbi:MAG: hypothetical protein V2I97_24995 [Desulfococcaceae bacterium]|nr:hypothetical protein [Desulfococcaceae bacterium]
MEEGIEKGKKIEMEKIAKNMLQSGMDAAQESRVRYASLTHPIALSTFT